MKKLALVFALTVTGLVTAQIQGKKTTVETVETMDDVRSGIWTRVNDSGINDKTVGSDVYRYMIEDFMYDNSKLIDVVEECRAFLLVNNLDFDSPEEEEATITFDYEDYTNPSMPTSLMFGDYVMRYWILDTKEEAKMVFLIVNADSATFSVLDL